MDMLSGRNPYLYAAAKSLPLHDDGSETEWEACSLEKELADDLLVQCSSELEGTQFKASALTRLATQSRNSPASDVLWDSEPAVDVPLAQQLSAASSNAPSSSLTTTGGWDQGIQRP
jgi:hypothetical protein